MLLPSGTCESVGLSQDTGISLFSFLLKYSNLSSNIRLGGPATNGSTSALFTAASLAVVCADTAVQQMATVSDLNRQLYCGFRQARCNGSSVTAEYGGAWDFKDSRCAGRWR